MRANPPIFVRKFAVRTSSFFLPVMQAPALYSCVRWGKSLMSRKAILMLSVFALFSGESRAATTTSTFTVQMTITSSCGINSASTLNFGSSGVISAAVPGTSTLQVQCTNTTPFNIGLDVGQGTGATTAARLMTNGANTITYALYQDSGHATLWGTNIGTNTVASTGTGASQSFTVYGLVPAQTTPPAAVYSDTILSP
jgi:spore coat protein U-like protein